MDTERAHFKENGSNKYKNLTVYLVDLHTCSFTSTQQARTQTKDNNLYRKSKRNTIYYKDPGKKVYDVRIKKIVLAVHIHRITDGKEKARKAGKLNLTEADVCDFQHIAFFSGSRTRNQHLSNDRRDPCWCQIVITKTKCRPQHRSSLCQH